MWKPSRWRKVTHPRRRMVTAQPSAQQIVRARRWGGDVCKPSKGYRWAITAFTLCCKCFVPSRNDLIWFGLSTFCLKPCPSSPAHLASAGSIRSCPRRLPPPLAVREGRGGEMPPGRGKKLALDRDHLETAREGSEAQRATGGLVWSANPTQILSFPGGNPQVWVVFFLCVCL